MRLPSKVRILGIAVLAFTSVMVVNQLGDTDTKTVTAPVSKSNVISAPDFSLQTLDGKELRLSDYKGKVVILNFWATWCGPCRLEIPGLIKLTKKYRQKDVVVIGVSTDTSAGPVASFIQEYGINYPIVMSTREMRQTYGGVTAIPMTFVIDQNQTIVNRLMGYESIEYFESYIIPLLEEGAR
ncbi:TlpA family protein disulfide reductase [bacterium]|jgi:peroxiredoxin|nr:TlpA family protein disulfide reductase [bacterium]